MQDNQLDQLDQIFQNIELQISTIEANVLNDQFQLKMIDELFQNCSLLLEKTFSEYKIDFLIAHDYFNIYYRIRNILKAHAQDQIWKLYQNSQLIISNIKNANDLNKILDLKGFHLFFENDIELVKMSEVIDYFINIMKSLVMKLDKTSNFEKVENLVLSILDLSNYDDNLVQTTVRNIVLFLLRLDNHQCQEFIQSYPFLFHFIDIIRQLRKQLFQIDSYIMKSQTKSIQQYVHDIHDQLEFIEEIVQCSKNDKLKNYVKNGFILGIIIQLILPSFYPEINVNTAKYLGINSILFLMNSINEFMQKSSIWKFLLDNIIIQDKINFEQEEIHDFNLFHFENCENFQKSNLKNLQDLNMISQQSKDSKLLKLLFAFFKSKDDNMLLLTSNLFITIFENLQIEEQVSLNLQEQIIDLLNTDPSFRFVTCQKLAKIFIILNKKNKEPHKQQNQQIFQNFQKKIEQQNKILSSPHLRDLYLSYFKQLIDKYDTKNYFNEIEQSRMNWLCLYNYNFLKKDKELRYLDIRYKYDLNQEEFIEIEIRMFILWKNLRYECIEESVLIDHEKNLQLNYKQKYANFENQEYYKENVVKLNFDENQILKNICEGPSNFKTQGQKLIVCLFGREFILFQHIKEDEYKVLNREYYASFLIYFDRSNPCLLNLSSKQKMNFWGILFPSYKECSYHKQVLDEIKREFQNQEEQFIKEIFKKFSIDTINQIFQFEFQILINQPNKLLLSLEVFL